MKDGRFMFVYVGSFTEDDRNGRGEGISVYRMHPETGSMARVQVLEGLRNPSFLALHPNGRFLYAVNSAGAQAVSVCERDPADGTLTAVQQIEAEGSNPVHLDVHPTGSHLAVATYGPGKVVIYPILADGRLGPPNQVIVHEGPTGPVEERQDQAHPHQTRFDPNGTNLLVTDLGLDRTYVYRFDAATGELTPGETPFVNAEPGHGPRHLDFHPNGRYVYVVNELASTILTLAYDGEARSLRPLQTLSTLPAGLTWPSSAAQVVVHPSGRFVYASNRGHDSIACFAVDEGSGHLTLMRHVSTQGEYPRNFNIDPSGTLLFAANQEGDTMVTFRVDGVTGELTPTGDITGAQSPTCVIFG